MIIKLLGAGAVVISGLYIGEIFIRKLKKRSDFFCEFNQDIIMLKSRIQEREVLSRALIYVSNFSVYSNLWMDFSNNLRRMNVSEAFLDAIKRVSDELGLKENDLRVLNLLTSGLGMGDVFFECEHIDYVSKNVEMLYYDAKNKYNTDAKLIRTISLLIAIFIVILMI